MVMETVSNLLIVNVVLILLQCTSYMHTNCITSEYKILPGGFNVFLQKGVQPVFNTKKLNHITECAVLCINQVSCKIWRFGDGNCQIFHSTKDKVSAMKSSNTTMVTYYETDKDRKWVEMYFAKSESGFNILSTYLGKGNSKSKVPTTCNQKSCSDIYRSLLMDTWDTLPIDKVRFSLIKNNTEVLYLIFDGQGTNLMNWFAMSQLLESPWKDLHKGAQHNHFQVDYMSIRSFYVSKYHGGCPFDLGWIDIVETSTICSWESHSAYPQILYSDKDSAIRWYEGYAVADALAIYISF